MLSFKREVVVAFSRRAQPIWFRVTKWIVIIGITIWLWDSRYFWWWVVGSSGFGLGLHCFYRWKTRGWTRAWGGWDDVESGR
jgi:hypothetical protein